MQLTAMERDKIFSRLRVIGLPTEVLVPFLRDIERWISGSGLEWTISRLKAIKLDLLRKKAGLQPSSSWIRKGSKGRWFGGSVGALESWGSQGDNFSKMIQVLNIYTSFYAHEVTKPQALKFVSGVLADNISIPVSISQKIDLGLALSRIKSARKLPDPKPLITMTPSEKRGPTVWGSKDEIDAIIDSLVYLQLDGGIHLGKYNHLYSKVLAGLEPEVLAPLTLDDLPEDYRDLRTLVVGKIGLIQEPGFKLRAVANPGRVFQRVLQPLGSFLFKTLSDLPWDCTFDQSKADPFIQKALRDGKEVFSVDLSGATDYFPLDLQIQVLEAICPKDHVDLFRDVSKGLWSISPGILQETIDQVSPESDIPQGFILWRKGQPLGLYPSFASFALTHGLLLLGLLGKPYNGQFFVLGDDVVILDPVLYRDYRAALGLLACPVSESKTINSTRLAEFTSRIFVVNGEHPIPQLKWRHPSDDSFIDIVRLLGYKGLALLNRKQRKVAAYVAAIPDFMGGLGFNPDGLSLESRMKPFLCLLDKEYIPVQRLTDYSKQARQIVYHSKLSKLACDRYEDIRIPSRDLQSILDLDQRSRVVVHDVLGSSFVPWFDIMGKNIDLVLSGNTDLPGTILTTRRTAYQRWESLLVNLLGVDFGNDR